ncbi:MAG: PFL family protein [Candidatus Treponema excrementipullorum]|nr:PFL family protein [Spirochaetia bacterium]MDD7011891.1 PFL family protein [Candidatus Treponema excrementipullorum]MDY2755821.1 PFL family protein [Candidatus Treponema excrementipullorum]MDY4465841.1 PFL family protein [Candidatus Treponema excrementipullorum]MDY4708640.1 PFL family protein [Candidatus Treponema excrementipullorum]
MIFSPVEIQETVNMFLRYKLDVRAITMGISLRDCACESGKESRRRMREKILRYAGNLVETGRKIETELGVPIINKRIAVTPISLVAEPSDEDSYVEWAVTLDQIAKELEVDFIGGFSALVQKGITPGDRILSESIPEALTVTDRVCSSINLGTTKNGINMNAVKDMGRIIKTTAEKTKDKDGLGCAKLVVFCNAPEDNPFMAGAFHGPGEGDAVLSVGVSGPGVIKAACEAYRGKPLDEVADGIKKMAFKITRMGQLVGTEAAKRLGVDFGILDLSLAPTPFVGDSVARILEELGLESAGAPGTTAALAMLTDMVKKGGVMASTNVGGLSGAFIPVSEDEGMIAAVKAGSINLEKLEAMTCVCSVGLDMIAIPGDTPDTTISGIIADEMAIGMVNNKTTAVRVIPVPGKTVGDWAEFGGLLGGAPILPVSKFSCADFINRGGRIPAPIHSFRN